MCCPIYRLSFTFWTLLGDSSRPSLHTLHRLLRNWPYWNLPLSDCGGNVKRKLPRSSEAVYTPFVSTLVQHKICFVDGAAREGRLSLKQCPWEHSVLWPLLIWSASDFLGGELLGITEPGFRKATFGHFTFLERSHLEMEIPFCCSSLWQPFTFMAFSRLKPCLLSWWHLWR